MDLSAFAPYLSVIEIILAVAKPLIDVAAVIQAERRAALEELQEYTRLKADVPVGEDLGWLILVDSLIFKAEATARWLDACEARIARHGRAPGLLEAPPTDSPTPATETVIHREVRT